MLYNLLDYKCQSLSLKWYIIEVDAVLFIFLSKFRDWAQKPHSNGRGQIIEKINRMYSKLEVAACLAPSLEKNTL